MKLVVDGDTRVVLGAHILGPDAGEMAQLLGISLKARLTKDDFDRTMAVHPIGGRRTGDDVQAILSGKERCPHRELSGQVSHGRWESNGVCEACQAGVAFDFRPVPG